jgi:hypothetical protein
VEVGNPEGHREQAVPLEPKQETISIAQPKPESRPVVVEARPAAPERNEAEQPAAQPTLSDFGLYKCESCGKMVMGYEKGNHVREKHGGKGVEWRKVR